ncbi:MAG: endonuclease/exonuclease/phosphatase family protein [Bacteroidales bacterium]|nr:endonuclease/exonuclease/phosphatase family protein [Lentimicrobiaceae bacterium]MDD5695567.1 endonuclease/exonuclease/phosphatase family protein [Bacteroidales bacterium]
MKKNHHSAVIRLATYNAALFRNEAGELQRDLSDTTDKQARSVAEIIQIIRPEIMALLEFDYDPQGASLELFQQNYLGISQHGNDPVYFPYTYVVPSNTGIPTLLDLNSDSVPTGPEDAYGYGRFPGQYAFAILSAFPFDTAGIRTFQYFLWKDMPGAHLPTDPLTGQPYYSSEILDIFRLSSKNHIDLPVFLPKGTLHLLVAHPTPPTFDGKEDRNGKRNSDEIRFLADYITPGERSAYIYDDNRRFGGLAEDQYFVIMGDMNADPADGDSYNHAIRQLLFHPSLHHLAAMEQYVPSSAGSYENALKNPRRHSDNLGNPWHDTSIWGLRIDYILPSTGIRVVNSGVFWPEEADSLYYLVRDQVSSDHFLVWMDLALK